MICWRSEANLKNRLKRHPALSPRLHSTFPLIEEGEDIICRPQSFDPMV